MIDAVESCCCRERRNIEGKTSRGSTTFSHWRKARHSRSDSRASDHIGEGLWILGSQWEHCQAARRAGASLNLHQSEGVTSAPIFLSSGFVKLPNSIERNQPSAAKQRSKAQGGVAACSVPPAAPCSPALRSAKLAPWGCAGLMDQRVRPGLLHRANQSQGQCSHIQSALKGSRHLGKVHHVELCCVTQAGT
jgi:hypothetical protein